MIEYGSPSFFTLGSGVLQEEVDDIYMTFSNCIADWEMFIAAECSGIIRFEFKYEAANSFEISTACRPGERWKSC